MPLYEFRCSCGSVFAEFAGLDVRQMGCACGSVATRIMSRPQILIHEQDRAVNHGMTAEYDRWFYSDGCQAKLKSGEYRIATKEEVSNGFEGVPTTAEPKFDAEKFAAETTDEFLAAGGSFD